MQDFILLAEDGEIMKQEKMQRLLGWVDTSTVKSGKAENAGGTFSMSWDIGSRPGDLCITFRLNILAGFNL